MTPLFDSSTKLIKSKEGKCIAVPHAGAVGAFIYLTTCTINRSDISFAVGVVGQFMSCPNQAHWVAVKRIYRYLKGFINYCLIFEKTDNDKELMGYSDSYFASLAIDRKSISDSALFSYGNLISWTSKKQTSVSLSIAEAEYIALTHCVKEIIWLRSVLEELKLLTSYPTIIYEDNQCAIALSKDQVSQARSKHIDM